MNRYPPIPNNLTVIAYSFHQKFGLFIFVFFIAQRALCQYQQKPFKDGVIDIGVVVSDMERSKKFYLEVIGMKETGAYDLDEKFGSRSGLTGGLPLTIKVLKLEDTPSATEWKLMEFAKLSRKSVRKFVYQNIGMQYITINVNSITPFIEQLRAQKVKFLGETPITLADGRWFILIQDPDKNFIEIIGPK